MKVRSRVVASVAAGAVVAVVAVLANEQIDHYTSTDVFCSTSCHSMQAFVAGEKAYVESAHRTAKSGVRAGCADCHLPSGLAARTVAHVMAGARDTYVEMTNDFTQPGTWESRRAGLAHRVRDWLLATDSAPCRSCHVEEAIRPGRKRGQTQHADARDRGITCIACHYNLVHAEVEPRDAFIERAERGRGGG